MQPGCGNECTPRLCLFSHDSQNRKPGICCIIIFLPNPKKGSNPAIKRLKKYPWVKLPRERIPAGKGLMGAWMRLASRAAFRKGEGHSCGYSNPAEPGMRVGGIVGFKAASVVRTAACFR